MLRGEERAFDEFFAGHFPRLYRFAVSRLDQDADAAEEVVQATLCLAIRKLDTYRGEASLLTWLCTFCRHEISTFLERANRQPQALDLTEESPEVLAALESLWADGGADPEAEVRRKEIARLVHLVLDRLPVRYADALEWKYIDGLPVQEIADRLGLGLKAAESVLTRARHAFRDGFAAAGGASGPRRTAVPESS
jgi:RNA polymerase sigma-70 factor (ECF subfamily)